MRHSRHRKSLGSMPPSGNNVVGSPKSHETEKFPVPSLEGYEMLSLSVTRPKPKTAVTRESERASEEQTEMNLPSRMIIDAVWHPEMILRCWDPRKPLRHLPGMI